jgi:hypothetical protein
MHMSCNDIEQNKENFSFSATLWILLSLVLYSHLVCIIIIIITLFVHTLCRFRRLPLKSSAPWPPVLGVHHAIIVC